MKKPSPDHLPKTVLDFISGLMKDSDDDYRLLLAMDSKSFHLRKTLCVTHHEETGEVTYDAKPISSYKNLQQLYAHAINNFNTE